jgi:hypothetical protein
LKYNINDVLTNANEVGAVSSKEVRLPCPLGDKCSHPSSKECDQYRQQLLEEEHKRTCKLGKNCKHFFYDKGVPEYAHYYGESPADYLLRTRGLK